MTGWDLVRAVRVRNVSSTRGLPALRRPLLGRAERLQPRAARAAQVDFAVTKLSDPDAILEAIERALAWSEVDLASRRAAVLRRRRRLNHGPRQLEQVQHVDWCSGVVPPPNRFAVVLISMKCAPSSVSDCWRVAAVDREPEGLVRDQVMEEALAVADVADAPVLRDALHRRAAAAREVVRDAREERVPQVVAKIWFRPVSWPSPRRSAWLSNARTRPSLLIADDGSARAPR
jgi:hypothetical protein